MRDDLKFNPARPQQHQNYMITNLVSSYDDLGRTSVENMIKNVDRKNIDFLEQSESKSLLHKIAFYFNLSNPLEWIFLLFFSVIVTIFILIFDKILLIGIHQRMLLTSTDNQIFNFLMWISTGIGLILLATCVGYFISADADGSGMPEIKTVFSGINIYKYFSFNAFIGKVIGLLCALIGGL